MNAATMNGLRINSVSEREPETIQTAAETHAIDVLVLEAYKEYKELTTKFEAKYGQDEECASMNSKHVLTPFQINQLLITIITKEDTTQIEHKTTGYYLSNLINNSIQKGHKEFTLETKDNAIDRLGYKLKGTKNTIPNNKNVDAPKNKTSEYITIHIKGSTGDFTGICNKYINWNIEHNKGNNTGSESKNCTYNITKNEGMSTGRNSENCTYNITNNEGTDTGRNSNNCTYNLANNEGINTGLSSENCTYSITNNKGRDTGWNSKNCIYQTSNQETYEQFLKEENLQINNNDVRLIK